MTEPNNVPNHRIFEILTAVRINGGELGWFDREDFQAWRMPKDPTEEQPATWCSDPTAKHFHDVFLIFECPEYIDPVKYPEIVEEHGGNYLWQGSNTEGLPKDIYQFIGKFLCDTGLHYGVLWICPV